MNMKPNKIDAGKEIQVWSVEKDYRFWRYRQDEKIDYRHYKCLRIVVGAEDSNPLAYWRNDKPM